MTDRVYQFSPSLGAGFNRYGCNTRSTLGLVETYVGEPLSLGQLTDALAQMRDSGLTNELWGMHEERSYRDTIKIAARLFERPKLRGEQVGCIYIDDNGLSRAKLWGGWGSWTACIVHYNSQADDGHHVEGDRWFREVFNPDPTVRISTIREILLYRLWEEM